MTHGHGVPHTLMCRLCLRGTARCSACCAVVVWLWGLRAVWRRSLQACGAECGVWVWFVGLQKKRRKRQRKSNPHAHLTLTKS